MVGKRVAVAAMIVLGLWSVPLPVTADQHDGERPAPYGGRERPYYESDTDDHPEDWQPSHDHTAVRHSIMADCSGDDYQQQLLCVWTPVTHPDLAGYQVWRNGPERDKGVLVAEIRNPATTVYWHTGHEPVVGVEGFAIRAVDAQGKLLDHTMPFPYRRHSSAPRRSPGR